MKTSKSISCVTYNTPKFLKLKLTDLVSSGKISFWCFILHKGEEELDRNTGTLSRGKDHIHLFVQPNICLNTMDLDSLLLEKDKKHKLPLKPVWWESSDWDNWYLYTCHDYDYLASKFLTKEFSYTDDEFIVSSQDSFDYLRFKTRHESKLCSINNLVDYLRNGGDVSILARNGVIKPQQAFAFKCYDDLLRRRSSSDENS